MSRHSGWMNGKSSLKRSNKVLPALTALTLLTCQPIPPAHAEPSTWDILQYATLGVWASTPLKASARVGLAIPLDKDSAIVVGNEFGLAGNKQFVGWRTLMAGHGVAWGGVDIAHWQTRTNPALAHANTDYFGLEAQVLFLRAGLMFPTEGHGPRITLGTGLSF